MKKDTTHLGPFAIDDTDSFAQTEKVSPEIFTRVSADNTLERDNLAAQLPFSGIVRILNPMGSDTHERDFRLIYRPEVSRG
jgi:hypothetical protein